MKAYNITRHKTDHDVITYCYTASSRENGEHSTHEGFSSYMTVASNGERTTYEFLSSSGTTLGNSSYNVTGSQSFEAWRSIVENATGFNSIFSQSAIVAGTSGPSSSTTTASNYESYSTNSSNTFDQFYTWATLDETMYTANLVTSSNVNTTTSIYSVTGSSLFTTSVSTTAKSTLRSSAVPFGTTTVASHYPVTTNYVGTTHTSQTVSTNVGTYLDIGLVFTVENEWIWIPADLNTSINLTPRLLSNLAASVTAGTLWPQVSTSAYEYAGFFNSSSGTQTIPANSSGFTIQYIAADTTSQTTITTGDNFLRSTTTVSYNKYSVSTESTSWGNESYTVDALTTSARQSVLIRPVATLVSTLIEVEPNNYRTTTLSQTTGIFSTISEIYTVDAVCTAYSTTAPSSTYEFGLTYGATYTYQANVTTVAYSDAPWQFSPVPPRGAFIAPQKLNGGSEVFSQGSNLSFNGGTIFYPFTASVYGDVRTPAMKDASTTQTDSRTWRYKWQTASSGATLYASEESTHTTLSSTRTVTETERTTYSGNFSTAGSVGTNFATSGNGVMGGFQDISTAAETVYFPKRAAVVYEIGTDGSSSSYRSVFTSTNSTTMTGSLRAELPAEGFVTYLENAGGVLNYLQYPRNLG